MRPHSGLDPPFCFVFLFVFVWLPFNAAVGREQPLGRACAACVFFQGCSDPFVTRQVEETEQRIAASQ